MLPRLFLPLGAVEGEGARKKVLILGGGESADQQYRSTAFVNYEMKIAGNHTDADIQGDWNNKEFWASVGNFGPDAIVIDIGSDSWLTNETIENFVLPYVTINKIAVIFSPFKTRDDAPAPDCKTTKTLTSTTCSKYTPNINFALFQLALVQNEESVDHRYAVRRFDGAGSLVEQLLFVFGPRTPIQMQPPSEVVGFAFQCFGLFLQNTISEKQEKERVKEIKACYKLLDAIVGKTTDHKSFFGAVAAALDEYFRGH
jgi:hypothetical protein